jgi:hypothetical protein
MKKQLMAAKERDNNIQQVYHHQVHLTWEQELYPMYNQTHPCIPGTGMKYA